ncbi:MAG: phosphatase PAP2 family protein, partial [Flammeovirgaceae bacterium]|nr:phosphatase PAP2 family protein [Flammeovirgaceae bacterium]
MFSMLELLKELDKVLFLWLNGWHTPFSDLVFWTATKLIFWIPFYVLILILLTRKYRIRVLWIIFALAITILLADQFANFCKNFFERLRPSHEPSLEGLVHLILQENGEYYRGGRFGFISGHASNTFGIASFLFFL